MGWQFLEAGAVAQAAALTRIPPSVKYQIRAQHLLITTQRMWVLCRKLS